MGNTRHCPTNHVLGEVRPTGEKMKPRCDLCKHWSYKHPDDLGICKVEREHPNGVGLMIVTTGGKLKTSCDTRCDDWESDGTEKAKRVVV